MKVLLVNPEFPDTYWSFRHALFFEGKKSAYPPLGLLTVAAMLPAKWERRLVDMEVRRLNRSDLEWADMVFVTAMLVQKASLLRTIERARALGKRVVIGGPYVSTTEELPDADHIFIGETEHTLPQFFTDLEHGEPKPIYRAPDKPPLALTPVPDFSLAELNRYAAMSIQYSRGCPFNCEFCDIIEIYGRVPRTKSNQQVMAELDALYQVGWRGTVFIVDDNFIGNKRNVKKLMPDLVDWQRRHGHPFTLLTEASVNLADDDVLLETMRSAGFRTVFLGIETPVAESLKEAQKMQNRGDLLASVKKIQSYGMEVMGGFIVGFDHDPEDIFQRQINFIRDSAIPLAMVGILNALPDTQLWRRLKHEGRLLAESAGNNTSTALNFIPRMDPKVLVEGYRSVVETIYTSKEYYQRALECLRRVSGTPPAPMRYSVVTGLIAFSRIILKLGLLDRERKEFWKFFHRAVKEHRGQFAQSMRLAAMGYHFRKLNESYAKA
ncbi:MAG TPA: radical SAM protein [Pyrinomonadaceae bacterium]